MNPDISFEPSVTILGFGNVGFHFALRFAEIGITIDQIYSRSEIDNIYRQFVEGISIIHELSALLPKSSIYILCISDDDLVPFANQLRLVIPLTSTVCHTSGRVSSSALNQHFAHSGCIYPFQSLSKDDHDIHWDDIPIFITSPLVRTQEKLAYLARQMTAKVEVITDLQKSVIQLCGVLANNFTNKLIEEACDLLKEQELDVSYLYPLLDKTISKIKTLSPRQAQTGPAKRGDTNTIEKHLDILHEKPNMTELYIKLSLLINPTLKINR